mgnify:CR=1 FL=1
MLTLIILNRSIKVVMRIESKLCHLSENKAIVQVQGWLNDKNIGSALAEGTTVEDAEDKAISRLNNRISKTENNQTNIIVRNDDNDKNNNQIKVELPKSERIDTIYTNQEPIDWSNELTEIDSEIERLNWSRDDEIEFLEKNFGYNNRNKITKYNELLKYLGILKKIENSNSSLNNMANINKMIEESDVILNELSWNNRKGREYLQKEFNVSTRKELNTQQLVSFVNKLKSIRNEFLSQ